MSEPGGQTPILSVVFYTSASGREPVREWLGALNRSDRRAIGIDIKTAQYGWPIGMPLVRKIEAGLWEIRSRTPSGSARVTFTVEDDTMVLLHGFVKTSQKTPATDLKTARQRLAQLGKR